MEYQILQADSLMNVEQLNEQAQSGWRLVTVIEKDDIFYFYFERAIWEPANEIVQ